MESFKTAVGNNSGATQSMVYRTPFQYLADEVIYDYNHKIQKCFYEQNFSLQVDDWRLYVVYSGYLNWGAQWHSEYDDPSYLDASVEVKSITHADNNVCTESFGFGSKLSNLLEECVNAKADTNYTNCGRLTFSFDFAMEIDNIIRELETKTMTKLTPAQTLQTIGSQIAKNQAYLDYEREAHILGAAFEAAMKHLEGNTEALKEIAEAISKTSRPLDQVEIDQDKKDAFQAFLEPTT